MFIARKKPAEAGLCGFKLSLHILCYFFGVPIKSLVR